MDSIQLIDDGVYDFKGETFDSEIHLSNITVSKPRYLRFFKCTFNFPLIIEELHFPNIIVSFSQCTFNEGVKVYRCNVLELKFTGIIKVKDINIEYLNSELLRFNSQNVISDDFTISKSIIRNFDCSNLEDFRGRFLAEINRHSENNNPIECSFRNSSINSLELYGNIGSGNFERLSVKEGAFFNANFDTSYFNNSFFGRNTTFNDCEFSSTVSFKNCRVKNEMNFQVCNFKKHVFFSNAEFQYFSISDTTFEARVSFLGMEVENINTHLVNFNRIAHFDEIKIKDILSCNRKTLRTIKQELYKTDNKIDYNRFRAYELAAYYRELNFKKNFVDKSVLGLTILFTGYNYNWFRAFIVTVLTGMLFYSILYFFEFYVALNLNNDDGFSSGAFRFFLVTDFFSPFLDRKYLNNGYSWTIFVLGKIFIAFGIYEMIQAFRKFKA